MAAPDPREPDSREHGVSSSRPSWEAAAPPARRPEPRVPAPSAPPADFYAPAAAPVYAAPPETDVKYDLAGNPIPNPIPNSIPASGPAASAASSFAPPAPFSYSAGSAAGGAWPPSVGGAGHGAHAYRNNSGEQSHLPPEIERLRWHWGAFFFPIFWTRKHGLTTIASALAGGLLLLRVLRYIFAALNPSLVLVIWGIYGVAYFSLQVYGGLNGHKIGWRNRHFPGGLEEYFKVQSAWMWWGFGINLVLVPALWFLFLAAIVGTALTGHQPAGAYSGYGSGSSNPGSSNPGSRGGNAPTSGQ